MPHLVQVLLSVMNYKIFCPTYSHSLMIWHRWGTSIFALIPHHPMPDSYLVFWSFFDLHQYVDFLIHIHGHSLDLMICSTGCTVPSALTSDLISDHFSVVADLYIPSNHSQTVPQTIKYRQFQSINFEAFKADIQNSELIRDPKMQLNWLNDMTVSSALSSIFMPRWLPKRSPQSLLTHGWLLISWLLKYIIDIWSLSGVGIRPH